MYALDLLGMGNSSRPHFRVHSKDPVDKIDEAEAFFIDALEEWRQAKKIDKMTLMVFIPLFLYVLYLLISAFLNEYNLTDRVIHWEAISPSIIALNIPPTSTN